MRRQDFEVVRGDLLARLEELTVEEHRVVLGSPDWAPPQAYRWIRYEDPDPIGQLLRAGQRLDRLWGARPRAAFEAREREVVAEAISIARDLGYQS